MSPATIFPGHRRSRAGSGRATAWVHQLARLYALIAGQDPRQLQFEFALWTREMIREVIRREFKVALSVVSVGRLLRKPGLSSQQPLHRAYQQDPEAVQRWKKEAYQAPGLMTATRPPGCFAYRPVLAFWL